MATTKNYFALYTLSLSLILLQACSSKEKNRGQEIKLIVEKEFQLDEKARESLPNMYTVAMDNPSAEELAFSNVTSPISIVITDHQGKFIEKIGAEGRGPKEILDTRYFGFDENNNVLILDKASAFFKKYNRTTGDVSSFEYPIKKGVSVTSRNLQECDGKWYMAVQLLGEPTLPTVPIIAVFDSSFALIDTLGGYDPFFEGRKGILQEPLIDVDCDQRRIYTSHAKTPYLQVFSMDTKKLLNRTSENPSSFMLSETFVELVSSKVEMTRYMSEEQSLSLMLGHSKEYIFHLYRNGNNNGTGKINLNDRHHFLVAYDKESLNYVGETTLSGAVLGYTKEGELIVLKDELNYEFQFLKVHPVDDVQS